jgi:hypothetical protein
MGASEHHLSTAYEHVRQRTLHLAEPLTAEDCCAQSMPDASPIKWHLAHTTWFFETFILEPREPGFRPHDPAFRVLFNSYYNGVGARCRPTGPASTPACCACWRLRGMTPNWRRSSNWACSTNSSTRN